MQSLISKFDNISFRLELDHSSKSSLVKHSIRDFEVYFEVCGVIFSTATGFMTMWVINKVSTKTVLAATIITPKTGSISIRFCKHLTILLLG